MKRLGPEEIWAKACIEQALAPRCSVGQHDDGSQPSMFDLTIEYPDGRAGAVEITTAVDSEELALAKALHKRARAWREPGLAGTWWVRVRHTAHARDIRQHLPRLLRELERQGIGTLRGDSSSPDELAALAAQLYIIQVKRWVTDDVGRIFVTHEQPPDRMGGCSPATGDAVAAWLSDWLVEPEQRDNLTKLAASQATERHMFVLTAGFGIVPFAVTDLLATTGAPLPTIAPTLPPEVTDVWVMSMWDNWGDGFRWSPDDGWSRFTKIPPSDDWR